jgi:hypothetical protein
LHHARGVIPDAVAEFARLGRVAGNLKSQTAIVTPYICHIKKC